MTIKATIMAINRPLPPRKLISVIVNSVFPVAAFFTSVAIVGQRAIRNTVREVSPAVIVYFGWSSSTIPKYATIKDTIRDIIPKLKVFTKLISGRTVYIGQIRYRWIRRIQPEWKVISSALHLRLPQPMDYWIFLHPRCQLVCKPAHNLIHTRFLL